MAVDLTADYDTFNGLAPEFQLTEKQKKEAPDYIFPREEELLAELREKIPRAKTFPQKALMAFLLARKHDIARTVEFLNIHLDKLEEIGLDYPTKSNPIPVPQEEMIRITNAQSMYRTGKYETMYKGRMALNARYAYMLPGEITYKDKMIEMVYWWYANLNTYTLHNIREGLILIADLNGVGWKNVDFSSEGQRLQKDMLHMFPGRMRSIYILNPNVFMKIMMKFGRIMYKAKVMDRVSTIEVSQLPTVMSIDNIPYDLGGTWKANMNEWLVPFGGKVIPKTKDGESMAKLEEKIEKLHQKAMKAQESYQKKKEKKKQKKVKNNIEI